MRSGREFLDVVLATVSWTLVVLGAMPLMLVLGGPDGGSIDRYADGQLSFLVPFAVALAVLGIIARMAGLRYAFFGMMALVVMALIGIAGVFGLLLTS
ncbi:hypothetical protein OIE66_27430 [Nonomuraea sp. NBC_01738]|uniref:hypothetical protein n=1 Tax=Nonomuraea sp. NBC_01738 TaxID=2976003 RepID=UPI002E124DA9|nr:hypothetical protein OIE66_27430 [Nonomuraea sp. NBC_01738]